MSVGSPSTLHSAQSLLSSVHTPSYLTPTSSQHTNFSSLQSSSISLLNKTETPKLSEEMLKQVSYPRLHFVLINPLEYRIQLDRNGDRNRFQNNRQRRGRERESGAGERAKR